MHNGNSNLRKLAMQAKKRLNGAFIEKQSCPKKDLNTATIYRNLYKNSFKIMSYKSDDEDFYKRVKENLINFPDNPKILQDLVDYDKFSSLSEEQKMAYMLDLAEKLARAKQRFYNEKYDKNVYLTA